MIVFLRLLPAFLCGLVTGAHFLRGGLILPTVICALLPFLTLRRRPWVRPAVQVMLGSGAFMWLLVGIDLARLRVAMGGDPQRLLIILLSVAAVHAVAAILLWGRRMDGWFRVKVEPAPEAETPAAQST